MSDVVNIGGRAIGRGHPTFIIAEIGANFATLAEARRQVDAAARAGCDAVKVQTFRADTLVRRDAMFTFEDGTRVPQFDFFSQRELSRDLHVELNAYVAATGMLFFSTPSHSADVDLLESIDTPVYKIGSDDLTNLPLLHDTARRGKPIIVSTGMATMEEIDDAVSCVRAAGNEALILLHCVVGYPAPLREANLRMIAELQHRFDVPVGFSDHTVGILASTLAVACGGCVIEKHFTLDRSPGGPDNDTALEPEEMKRLVDDVRTSEAALGSGEKRVTPGEMKWREAARKSLVAARDLRAGERLTPIAIAVKRPADGLHPKHYASLVGRVLNTDVARDQSLTWDLLTDE